MNLMNEGIEMNNISLRKVTLLVTTCALASYFVSAEDKLTNLDVPVTEISVIKPVAKKVLSADNLIMTVKNIPALLTQHDNDKNGLLNETEVLASKKKLLVNHFKDIDKNNDAGISEEELVSYISALKAQKLKNNIENDS